MRGSGVFLRCPVLDCDSGPLSNMHSHSHSMESAFWLAQCHTLSFYDSTVALILVVMSPLLRHICMDERKRDEHCSIILSTGDGLREPWDNRVVLAFCLVCSIGSQAIFLRAVDTIRKYVWVNTCAVVRQALDVAGSTVDEKMHGFEGYAIQLSKLNRRVPVDLLALQSSVDYLP